MSAEIGGLSWGLKYSGIQDAFQASLCYWMRSYSAPSLQKKSGGLSGFRVLESDDLCWEATTCISNKPLEGIKCTQKFGKYYVWTSVPEHPMLPGSHFCSQGTWNQCGCMPQQWCWEFQQRNAGNPGPKQRPPQGSSQVAAGNSEGAVRILSQLGAHALILKCQGCSGCLSRELTAPKEWDNNCTENSGEAEGL